MLDPHTFQFNQGKLQDYVDCPRRFQLRHVLMQPWPALITDRPGELELHMQRGSDLHRLAHQRQLGLDPDLLASTIHDPVVATWWQALLAKPPAHLPDGLQRAEIVLAAPLASYRLVAKYDLLAADPGRRLLIVDWKAILKPPPRPVLTRRLQTRVYRYLAVEAGQTVFGGTRPLPEQVEMIYWFAPTGGTTQRFPYSTDQYEDDRKSLSHLVTEIVACQDAVWPLTDNTKQCRLCNYRSFCDRGVTAGFLADAYDDLVAEELDINLEQIAEIAF